MTPTYHQRLMQEQPAGTGLGVTFEGKAILSLLQQSRAECEVLPVLQTMQVLPVFPVSSAQTPATQSTLKPAKVTTRYIDIYAASIFGKPPIGTLRDLKKLSNVPPLKANQPSINISHLPASNYSEFVGREDERNLWITLGKTAQCVFYRLLLGAVSVNRFDQRH